MKRSTLMLYGDEDGWSFVVFDSQERRVYVDIVEECNITALYHHFSIHQTITNSSSFQPPHGIVKRIPSSVHTHEFSTHTSDRVQKYTNDLLTRELRKKFDLGIVLKTPLLFDSEEWTGWLA